MVVVVMVIVVAAVVVVVVIILEFFFFPLAFSDIRFILILDIFRVIFVLTVCLISLRVFMFRSIYMKWEKFYKRFHILLLSFVSSIMLLILSPNILRILIG